MHGSQTATTESQVQHNSHYTTRPHDLDKYKLLIYLLTSSVLALLLQQNRLCWYGHVLRKEDDDWVKKCMEYEVEGPRPCVRPKRTWREVVKEDCLARKLNKENAMERSKWKLIKDVR